MDPTTVLDILAALVEPLGRALGPQTEIVLHEFSHPESSIIAIANGHVTQRHVGDSSTNLALDVLKDPYGDHDKFLYRTHTKTGRVLKASSIYLKDREGRIFGSLCVNQDVTDLWLAGSLLRDMAAADDGVDEAVDTHIDDFIDQLILQAFESVRKAPDAMTKEEKVTVVRMLEDRGVFRVKNSVDKVALHLGVSRFTVYTYLNELQASRGMAVK